MRNSGSPADPGPA